MPVVGMSGLDGRSAVETSCGSGRKETRPKGGSVHKKKNKIQQIWDRQLSTRQLSMREAVLSVRQRATLKRDG